jgi:hypothetical protein
MLERGVRGGDFCRGFVNGGLFSKGHDRIAATRFTCDNIPGFERKVRLFRDLGALLNAAGKLVSVVSSPEIYLHEWASFSTKDFPENRLARSRDIVRIITTDFALLMLV